MKNIILTFSLLLVCLLGEAQQKHTRVIQKTTTVEEIPADFPGDVFAMPKFIDKAVKHSKVARLKKFKGTVEVGFSVEEATGKLSNFRIIKGKTEAMNQEALRIAKSMPQFTPAKGEASGGVSQWTIQIPFGEKAVK